MKRGNIMKQYRNFNEQVNDNTISIELIENADRELDNGDTLDYTLGNNDDLRDLELAHVERKIPESEWVGDDDQLESNVSEVEQRLDHITAWYTVVLKSATTPETDRLSIFYSEDLESYVMPVFSYGKSWTMLNSRN